MTLTLTYLGHSGILLSDGTHALCVDPFLTGNKLAEHKQEEITCDHVAFTHAHADHFNEDGLAIAQRNAATVIAPFELANHCKQRGIADDKIRAGNPGGRLPTPFGHVAFTPAIHSSSHDGQYMGLACGYVIHMAGIAVYHAGDTALFSDMKLIGEIGKPHVALLPVGGRYNMTPALARRAAEMIQPRIAIPIHYKTFPHLGQDIKGFTPQNVEVRELAPGQSITFG